MNNEELHIQFRFPLFRNEKWDLHKLSEIAEYTNGRAHEQDIETNGKYIVVNSKYISTDGEVVKYSNTANCLAEKNDILMVLSDVPNGRAIAKCYLVKEDNKYTVNQRICKITPKQGIESSLLYYLMNRNPYFLSFDDGVKQTNLRNDDVLNFEILLPTNPAEQQKIAACLSSLDDVIAGHEEKLTALEEHKKGLMQNLFPQEGSTQPKYRFPEFKNDRDWDVVPFSKYITLFRGSSPRPIVDFQTTDEDAVNWIKIGDTKNAIGYKLQYAEEKITHEGSRRSRPVVKGEIILANSMSYGKAYILELDGCIYDGWFVLRKYEEFFDKNYLIQLLNSDYLQNQYKKLAAGGIVQNISSDIVYNTELFHTTKEEQQKIALVLSSVDDLIIAQREKIEALKAHKKGLMQGLFPKIES